MLKKPLNFNFGFIADADGNDVCSGVQPRHGEQIVREINAFDAMLAACEECRDWMCRVQLGADVNIHEEFERRAALLLSAIQQANPAPASRPDTTC